MEPMPFNCPKCRAVCHATQENLSTPFSCPHCGHRSKDTFGELEWWQHRREHPDLPMPAPPVASPVPSSAARDELISRMYREGIAQGLSFDEIYRMVREKVFGTQGAGILESMAGSSVSDGSSRKAN